LILFLRLIFECSSQSDYEYRVTMAYKERNKPVIHRIVYDGHIALPGFIPAVPIKDFRITSIVINGILSEKTRLNKGKIY
jgi:hypothetical protein